MTPEYIANRLAMVGLLNHELDGRKNEKYSLLGDGSIRKDYLNVKKGWRHIRAFGPDRWVHPIGPK